MNRISVIIPTYQHASTLPRVLDSLASQLRQPDEIIVVDDGSTDGTREVLSAYLDRIKYILQENKGAPTARNVGFRESIGELVIFWDADVIGEPDMLKNLEEALELHEDASWAYSSFYWGKKLFLSTIFDQAKLRTNNYIHTSALIRRDAFPGFDESLKRFQDWDLWLTISKSGKEGFFVNKPLYKILIDEDRLGLSSWIPKIFYKIPWGKIGWAPKVIKDYNLAREVIVKKHSL